MLLSDFVNHVLHCHPAANSACPFALDCAVRRVEGEGLLLHYSLSDGQAQLLLPEPLVPGFADGLWQHTCFEAFIAAVDCPEYVEFNFSPSRQWAAYRFLGYRERDQSWLPPVSPKIEFECQTDDACLLKAFIPSALLPESALLSISLSAVLESRTGEKSYWALQHAAPQADFHLRSSFILNLPRP